MEPRRNARNTDGVPQHAPIYVTFPDLRRIFGLPYRRETLWRWRQTGEFPQPVQLSPNTIAWRSADIFAWLAAREGSSRQQADR